MDFDEAAQILKAKADRDYAARNKEKIMTLEEFIIEHLKGIVEDEEVSVFERMQALQQLGGYAITESLRAAPSA